MTNPARIGWRIALTEAGLNLGWFFARGLPPPTNAPYHDYSTRVSHSEGGQSRHGYKNVRMFWETLTRGQASNLRTVLQAGLDSGTGLIFLTIDRANGSGSGPDWIDVSGRPHMPDFDPSRFAGATNIVHQNVELFLNNLTIVNDPALFPALMLPPPITVNELTLAASAETITVV